MNKENVFESNSISRLIFFSKYNILNIAPEIGLFLAMPLSDFISFIVGIVLIKDK